MDVPLFLKQTSKARLPERVLRGSGRWCGPQEPQPAAGLPRTRVTYSLPRECPLGPGLQWPNADGTAPACCQGPWESLAHGFSSAKHPSSCACRYEEHHWPCLTRWQLSERMQKAPCACCTWTRNHRPPCPLPQHTADTGPVGPPPHPPWASEHAEGKKRASPPAQGMFREHTTFLAVF